MKTLREDEIRIATEAARWQETLAGADEKVRAEFADWIKASPRHLREFMFMEALDAAAQEADPEHSLEIATDLSGIEEPLTLPLTRLPPSRVRGASLARRRERLVGVAAAVLVCVMAGGFWWMWGRNTYVTDIGEQISVKLPDGSVMHLNTDSRAVVSFSHAARAIRLESGEALFKVERDAWRPFEVLTPTARIRVLGTEFNVRNSDEETRVAVVDGAVQVATLSLSLSSASGREEEIQLRAGDEAQVESKRIVRSRKPNIERAVSWRARRLVFQEEPLAEIADEFNRYNRTPKIVVEGGDARERRYGGTFNADDPQSLVRLITRSGDLRADRRGDKIVIRAH